MITKWRLFNFKSVRHETELALGPLTILAGPNSSGKSTLTQSMLLISQTLASKVTAHPVVLNGHLVRLGQFDDLRSFRSEADQIVIGWQCEQYLWGTARQRDRALDVSCEIAFEADPASPERGLLQLHPRLFSCSLSGSGRDQHNVDQTFGMTIGHVRPLSRRAEGANGVQAADLPPGSVTPYGTELDAASLGSLKSEHARDLPPFEVVGCSLTHFLPDRIVVRIDRAQTEADWILAVMSIRLTSERSGGLAQTLRDSSSADWAHIWLFLHLVELGDVPMSSGDFIPPPDLIIPERVVALLRSHLHRLTQAQPAMAQHLPSLVQAESPPLTIFDWLKGLSGLPIDVRRRVHKTILAHREEIVAEIRRSVKDDRRDPYIYEWLPLPDHLRAVASYVSESLTDSVRYLGPLRDEPKPLYPLAPTVAPSDIGLRGEHTAAVLDLHKDRLISYLPTANFAAPAVETRPSARSLRAAVLDWLRYMGVAEQVETRDRGKLGHELKVSIGEAEGPQDLTHVGVGVSQVLPILVMCLLAEKDTTLIIEQPELHLHPKVQTLLADFFLSMALLGKQCVIETHSEYIINRLRFRAASAAGDSLSNVMRVYFVEKKDGASSFREVVVNRYGAIPEWPDGFFDQSQSEAEDILRAATVKRKKERGGSGDA
jgi:predicted ATPase